MTILWHSVSPTYMPKLPSRDVFLSILPPEMFPHLSMVQGKPSAKTLPRSTRRSPKCPTTPEPVPWPYFVYQYRCSHSDQAKIKITAFKATSGIQSLKRAFSGKHVDGLTHSQDLSPSSHLKHHNATSTGGGTKPLRPQTPYLLWSAAPFPVKHSHFLQDVQLQEAS